jgi:hypothetical protein
MAEKFGKMKCKNYIVRNEILIITLFTLQVSKTQYSGQNTGYSTMIIWHIKRNSIVKIEKSIGYKRKWKALFIYPDSK